MAKAQAKKAKEEAKKTRDKAEQHGYNIGMAETEDALKARSQGCVGPTVPKYRMKPSTKLGLRLLLC